MMQSLSSAQPASLAIAPWASLTVAGSSVSALDGLSLVSLRFSDRALETAYATATVQSTFCAVDQTLFFHKLWISALLLVPILSGHIQSTWLGKALWIANICLLSAQLVLMKTAPKFHKEWRQVTIIPLKLMLSFILTAFVPTFVLKEVRSSAMYVEVLLLGAGLVMQLCTGVCIPVFWRHHLPLAVFTFTLYNYIMLESLADVFMCSLAAVSNTEAVYNMLDDTAYSLGGLLMPYPMQRPVAASPRAQVYILVLWLQLLLALVLPALYVYWAEFRSRSVFLQQRQRQFQQMRSDLASSYASRTSAGPSSHHPAQRTCSSIFAFAEHALPSQHVVLGAAFLVLFAIMTWNVLHLCIGWLMPVLDNAGPHRFVAYLAGQHGLGGSCFPS